uniref:Uncharacterized protein n=1 Tax=Rhizophora mucronata TaxID=61149 RepID=A0A2P2R528_RHIMU
MCNCGGLDSFLVVWKIFLVVYSINMWHLMEQNVRHLPMSN